MNGSLVSADSDAWAQAVRIAPHDVYHLASYARLCAGLEGGEAQGFVAAEGDCRLFAPLIVRDVPAGLSEGKGVRDATVPYGYPGPIVSRDGTPLDAGNNDFLQRALAALVERLRSEQIVSAFFRMHPLFPLDPSVLARFGTVVQSGGTVAIDLTLPEDTLWRQMRSNHRRDVTKAIAHGEIAEADSTWSGLGGFVQAYIETMTRVGASHEYFFSDEYFAGLRQALPEHLHLWVVRSGGEIAAGALFTECGGIVQYHLGGTLDRFLPGNPMKLLFHRATAWFKARGNRWLHLGGGVGGAHDSLMHFKLGFSPRTFPFYTWRIVVDRDTYQELLLARARRNTAPTAPADVAVDTGLELPVSSYFPAYRQPFAAALRGPA